MKHVEVTTKFGKFSISKTGKVTQLTFPKCDMIKLLGKMTAQEVYDTIISKAKPKK